MKGCALSLALKGSLIFIMVNLDVFYNVSWTVQQDSFIQQVNLNMSHLCF